MASVSRANTTIAGAQLLRHSGDKRQSQHRRMTQFVAVAKVVVVMTAVESATLHTMRRAHALGDRTVAKRMRRSMAFVTHA